MSLNMVIIYYIDFNMVKPNMVTSFGSVVLEINPYYIDPNMVNNNMVTTFGSTGIRAKFVSRSNIWVYLLRYHLGIELNQ